uniref:Focadhesin n=1 Tax=Cyprinodon variegatus TaxID=28743 RepID=A0A3Q2C776_CYPVA
VFISPVPILMLVGKDAQWEQILARAACIRDVCRERPYQHGGDMLAAISLTLQQCSRADLATPAALVLQGLQELCRAEVVDIVSTWRSLAAELRRDSRPAMVKAIAELLSLVPQLAVKSEEYEVLLLLLFSFLHDPEVSSCGYKALAAFPETTHTILHLPEAVRIFLPSMIVGQEGCLQFPIVDYDTLKRFFLFCLLFLAFELFLTSLVKQEMSVMPRGVYFSALRSGSLRSDQGKTVSGIPSFVLKTYEKNKQPGLKPGLAAGLLLCYELPVQTDRSGKPFDRFLVSRSRSYQQTLMSLIHEVNIQPSEWHRALLLPQAWRGFMSRSFHAVLQGRRADLEMQQKQGKEEPQELQYKQHCAWLWARDQLTDVIKTAIKDSPVVQGNSILALSGLAAVVAKYESNLPTDSSGSLGAGPEFVPTSSWLSMVLDTLLSISSSSYKARGQVFPWFLHRSYSGENTASAIARSCASLALSLLVPVLVVWQRDGLVQVLSALQAGLPGSPSADDSQAVQFHSGLALGMVLSSLHHQCLRDTSAQEDMDLLSSSLDALESCCFNPNLEYNTGCVLGLGLALSALCSRGQVEQQVHVTRTLDKLLANLQDSGGQGRMLQEVLSYSVACVSVSAFSGGLIDAAKAEEVLNSLRALTEESQQTPGFSLALGLVVHGLSVSGHGKAEDIQPRLLAAWIQILLAESCPTMQRLAAANGLVALVGSESGLIQLELSSQQQSRLNEVIRGITQVIITFSGAIGLQSNCACLIGHLHLAHMSSSHSHTAGRPLYKNLNSTLFSDILNWKSFLDGKRNVKVQWIVFHLNFFFGMTMTWMIGTRHQAPPSLWLNKLTVEHPDSPELCCSEMLIFFQDDFPLEYELRTRAHLYESLGVWMKHVAEDKLQVFVQSLGLQQFQDDVRTQRLSLCRSLLTGVAQAMALPNPPNHCWAVLCSSAEKIFLLLPNQIQVRPDAEVDLYVGVARCLSEMSDTEIDRIVQVSQVGFFFLHSSLVPSGSDGEDLFLPPGCVSKRMEWLLELMGHIRNIGYGNTSVSCGDSKLATDFLFQLFAAAVVSWGDRFMPVLYGLRSQWFPWQPESKPPLLTHSLYGADPLSDLALPQCLLGVHHSLPLLLDKEPWSSQRHKFIDWLLSISEGPEENISATAVAALLSLKSSSEFRKKAVWTRAYGW